MIKHEAKFTTKLVRWLKENAWFSGPVEIKMAQPRVKGGDRLCKSQFKAHQFPALRAASSPESSFAWKIPDQSLGALPFDLVVFSDAPAYVCAVFGEKRFYFVPIDDAEEMFKEEACVSEDCVALNAQMSGSL